MTTSSRFLHGLVWLAISLVHLGVFSSLFPLTLTAVRGLVNTVLLAALFYFNLWLLRAWNRPFLRWPYWVGVALACVVFTGLRGQINDRFSDGMALPILQLGGRQTWFWGSALSNLGILLLGYLFFFNERRLTAERNALTQAAERGKAELLQLRSQINPHFLFNVLNNVYALANAGSPRTAPTVLQLSHLLRYVTYQGQRPAVALGEEIAQLRRYLALFQLRGAKPFDISLEVDGDPEGWLIEPLLLLPLLENVFKHGDFVTRPNARACFRLLLEADQLIFTGENTYDPHDFAKDTTGGVGLENIQQRLLLTYGTAASLVYAGDSEAELYRVRLSLPRKIPVHAVFA